MSIRDYLLKLNRDQLQTAKNIADELIAEKDAELKIKLWVVSDRWTNKAAFLESDYNLAVQRLCDEIKKEAADIDDIELTLTKHSFRESEVQGMLDL